MSKASFVLGAALRGAAVAMAGAALLPAAAVAQQTVSQAVGKFTSMVGRDRQAKSAEIVRYARIGEARRQAKRQLRAASKYCILGGLERRRLRGAERVGMLDGPAGSDWIPVDGEIDRPDAR